MGDILSGGIWRWGIHNWGIWVERAILDLDDCYWEMTTYDPNWNKQVVVVSNQFTKDYKKRKDEGNERKDI